MSDLELNCGTNVDWIDTNRDGRGEIVISKFNEKSLWLWEIYMAVLKRRYFKSKYCSTKIK